MNIDFNNEQLVAFYRNTSIDGKKAIKEALGEKFSEELPIIERVRTYEDAVNELGKDNPIVDAAINAEWRYPETENKDIVSFLKLRVIVAALNDGWKPQFVPGEQRWYPWCEFISNDEFKDEKLECRCVCRSNDDENSYGGLVFSSASNASRLAFKSEALAKYAGKQFAELFADFFFIPMSDEKE